MKRQRPPSHRSIVGERDEETAPRETTRREAGEFRGGEGSRQRRPDDAQTRPGTRLSAWANKSRGDTHAVKSDDTDDLEGDEGDEGDGEEDSGAAPAPVGLSDNLSDNLSPSQNLADARRELRLRRSEEVELGARRILIAGGPAPRGDEHTDGDAEDDGTRGVVLGFASTSRSRERRDRIMRETKAELREIRRRETERRLKAEGAAARRRRGDARGSFEGSSSVDRTGSKRAAREW